MLNLSASATSHLVDRLVERGFVTRDEDTTDRRQKNVAITAAGLDIVQRSSAARRQQIGAGVADIEPERGGPPGCQGS
ncbi:MAG: MarR family transcriptional regulator [Myxococcales bacterium]|nr:MarR family transcriptional regulator [Myxococcales bacterium]